jgi:DNA-binding IclR family transcriptional regulator
VRVKRAGAHEDAMSTTLTKALTLIETLSERETPWSISELALRLALPKSNVHFLLSTLCRTGYVEQEAQTRRYFLTLKLWELGTRVLGRLDLRRVASPHLAALAEATSETVNLAILDHGEVLYLHKIDSPMPVRAYTPEGRRAPAYCTSTGKALLAWQPPDVIERVAATIEPHTGITLTSRRALLAELAKVRALGYSMNRGEWRDSVRGAAAPVFDGSDTVVAAVGVFGPAERLPYRKLDRLATTVKTTAASISRALGHRGSRR